MCGVGWSGVERVSKATVCSVVSIETNRCAARRKTQFIMVLRNEVETPEMLTKLISQLLLCSFVLISLRKASDVFL